MLHCKNSR